MVFDQLFTGEENPPGIFIGMQGRHPEIPGENHRPTTRQLIAFSLEDNNPGRI